MSWTHTAQWVAHAVGGTLSEGVDPQLPLSRVVTDSRDVTDGTIFVAIAGEHSDGHDYTAGLSQVDCLVIASRPVPAPHVLVQDTVTALGDLARAHLAALREQGDVRVVGMTGSVGKTTTKDLTRQLLASQASTVAPVASFNNEIGLPLTVLRADADTRYLVLEMGASGPGHIAYLTDIAPLDAAAVLIIGHAHMGGFGSIDGVARAKSEIITGLREGGIAILNAADPRALAMAEQAPGQVLTFSSHGQDADITATDCQLDDDAHAHISVAMPGLEQPVRLRLAVPGRHNVDNALAAASLAYACGMPAREICHQLERAHLESPHRMAVSHLRDDLLMLDDSYNANIDSLRAALAAFPTVAGSRRRVVIVSDMLELGESTIPDHEEAGRLAVAAGADVVIGVGEASAHTVRVAAELGVPTTHHSPDADTLMSTLGSLIAGGDAVLLKGSNGSGAWRVADHLKEAYAS